MGRSIIISCLALTLCLAAVPLVKAQDESIVPEDPPQEVYVDPNYVPDCPIPAGAFDTHCSKLTLISLVLIMIYFTLH